MASSPPTPTASSKGKVFLQRLFSFLVLWALVLGALFSTNPLVANYVFLLVMIALAGFGLAEFYRLVGSDIDLIK